MIARFAACAIAFSLLGGASASAKDWTTVTIALEGAYEPWNSTKPDGTLDGFEPELAKDLCARMKVECKLIAQDWDGMMAALQAGKFDVIMDALSITPDREKVIAFSKPYANTPAGFAVTKSGALANLAGTGTTLRLDVNGEGTGAKEAIEALRKALTGKSIGIQAATVYADFIYKNFKDVATIREYKTSPEHDLDLTAGRIDAAFDDATYFTSAFAKPDNADLAMSGPEFGGLIWGAGEALGLRKADTDLKAKFDEAITAALADGTVKKLALKWFKLDVSP
ncbi:transporter substrate-binding domain-containing protein [Labrys wisconsinensis]|uniref:Octopine/nopaline transport system substrate-binding protein n=1 Tax=Labrys wisconsinensis TaxID=425677 RepID=A0ABU0J1Y4_9HYPH|nr:transporter substrate-binding domain-containing protein [Labrys wisconsinensis]MDQ0467237.1 octopine/nopaline transport system substrate-binding protein [Labrys wisconsinensis]